MNSSRLSANAGIAAGLLAALCALGHSVGLAAEAGKLAWAPSREDAIVVEGVPTAMLPADSALSPGLLAQRPRSLSRPAPARMPGVFSQGTAVSAGMLPGEPLPSVTGTPLSPEGLPVPPEMYYDANGGLLPEGYAGDECGPCGPNGRCGPGQWGGWGACVWVPLCIFVPRPPIDAFELFGGVQGFTGPANRGGSGSFGFHEGFNWGLPLLGCMAWQWGANWTQSNFDGNYLTNDTRQQIFVTGGLFRRVDWGFQGGLVVDYLHDEWDYSADLVQLRGELSWLLNRCNDIGFWFAAGVNDAQNLALQRPVFSGTANTVRFVNSTGTLEVNDLYAFFLRRQFATGGQGRLFGGFKSNSQGLVGGDASLPLNPCWSLRGNFLYVTPGSDDSPSDPRFTRESWNVSVSFVWTPFAGCRRGTNYYRPLFNVADNGTFVTRLTGP